MLGSCIASIDMSVVVAILMRERPTRELMEWLADADACFISAATLVEAGIVIETRLGPAGAMLLERFLRDCRVDVVDVDRSQVDRALEGWRPFGKGRHRARLNLGDCFSYALAAHTGHPLLCVGDDFPATDLDVIRLQEAQ